MKRELINDHLANERTLLSWLRTAIGIMGFGFVVVKFSLFIVQLETIMGKEVKQVDNAHTEPVGIMLIAIGTLSLIFALTQYRKNSKRIDKGDYKTNSLLLHLLFIALIIIGVFLIYSLIG